MRKPSVQLCFVLACLFVATLRHSGGNHPLAFAPPWLGAAGLR